MKRALIALAGTGLVVGTAVFVVPMFLPREAIKARVVQELEAATGWYLRVDGGVEVSLFPGLHLTAKDVGLSGEAGTRGLEFAKAEAVEFSLAWGALFGGAVQVTGVRLDAPRLQLEIAADGQTSWAPRQPMKRIEGVFTQFDGATPAPEQPAQPASEPPAAVTGGDQGAVRELSGLTRVGFDDVEIVSGQIAYTDARSGRELLLTGVDARLAVPDLAGPARLSGTATWQGLPVKLEAEADSPVKLAGGAAAAVSATLSSGATSLSAKGSLGLAPLALDLRLDGKAASLAEALALTGSSPAELPALAGAVSLSGRVAASPAEVLVHEASFSVGAMTLAGAAQAELGGKAPRITGRVQSTGGTLADVLTLTGRSLPAEGAFATDLAFSAQGQSTPELLASLALSGSVTLSDGTVSGLGLAGLAGGDPQADRLTGLNMTAKFDGLDKPIAVTGQVKWRDEPFAIRGKATPAPLLAGLPAPLEVKAQGQRVTIGFDGRVAGAKGLDGDVVLDTADLRGLLSWLGRPLPKGDGLKNLSLAGQLAAAPDAVSFSQARFTLDGIKGTGEGSLRLSGTPKLTAKLALESLPLDPYLGRATSTAAGGKQPGGKTPKTAAPAGWSNAPVDFGGLAALDADLSLTAGAITWDKISIGESKVAVLITNGTLAASLERMALYGGSGKGNLSVEGGARQPRISAALELAGLNGRDFLRDAAGISWLQGQAGLSFDVTTQGGSEAELVGNLGGTARVAFADGAILGVNIPKMVRGLAVETLLGWQTAKDNQTDFTSLSASFSLQNGVAVSSDLAMNGLLLQMTGGGTTDMPAMTLDWRVEPQIVPSLEGIAPQPRKKGADKVMGGLGVPIVIRGPWSQPQIYPDIQGILENPAAAYKQLEEVGGGFVKLLRTKPEDVLNTAAGKLIEQATGGKTQIDVQKVLDGEVNDQEVLKAVEQGFGLPSGFLGSLGVKGLQPGQETQGEAGPVVIPDQPAAPPPP